MRRALLVLAAILALVLGGAAAFSLAADTTASCTQSPVVTDTDTAQSFTIECSVPKPAAVTETVTVPGPTVTETVTATPKPSATPTPSSTPTVTPTVTPTPTATATPTVPPPTTGFPDASTAGVTPGTTLKRIPQDVKSGPGWSYDSRGWVSINGPGTVFEGYQTTLNVDITASNVTVRNNELVFNNNSWGFSLRHANNVTIERNTIRGGSTGATICDNAVRDIYGDSDGVKILRNNIYNCASGINHFNRGGLIQGNYIHDLGAPCSGNDSACGHYNGIQLGAGSGPLMTIDNNTILVPYGYTDAIMLANDDGAQANRTITNNLLAGGAYTFYGSGSTGGVATGIRFTGNQFSTRYFARSGQYGPVAYWKSSGGNAWSGNTWADGPNAGKPVNP